MCTIFYIAPTCFSIIISTLQGADTKISISLKHTAKKNITISIHMLLYQYCRSLHVLVKMIYKNII